VLTCKSLFGLGYRGERLIEPSSRDTSIPLSFEHTMADTNANASWLKTLSPCSAKKLLSLMVEYAGDIVREVPSGVEFPWDFQYFKVLDDSVSPYATGAEFIEYATCKKFGSDANGVDLSAQYPRFQLNWKQDNKGVWRTPIKRTRGQLPMLKQVKDVLDEPDWESFKTTFQPEQPDKAAISVKILAHHIAYNAQAKSAPKMYPELPGSTGAGVSISHLCDNKCFSWQHLIASSQSDNMDRQRCIGMILLCTGGVICQVVNCPHFEFAEDGSIKSPNCCRFKVIDLSFTPGGEHAAAFEAAHESYVAAVGSAVFPHAEVGSQGDMTPPFGA
jgi:hypothetical protein